MIAGLGTDVVQIDRMRKSYQRLGDKLLSRVLSERECQEAEAFTVERRVEFLAGRFAAKEAIAKAAGCGLGRLGMPSVDISVAEQGLRVRFLSPVEVAPWQAGNWHLSITHSADVAIAVAIREV